MIIAKNIVKTYGKEKAKINALNGIDFELKKGEFVSICGKSGCGKSTLLNIIGCLEKPTSGELYIDDSDVGLMKDEQLSAIIQSKIGFIFQNYNLIPTMSALENVMLPMQFAGKQDNEIIKRANVLLKMVDMQGRLNHKPSELSGGEQQRVAIARALVNDPALIIGDEPTGNLDSTTGNHVMEILDSLHKNGKAILLVTHDSEVAAKADKILHITDGRFTEGGV